MMYEFTEEPETSRRLQKWRHEWEKRLGRQLSDAEVVDLERRTATISRVAASVAMEQVRREIKLQDFPKGFRMDKEGYCCMLCGDAAQGENSWYDRYGLKCRLCQHAVDTKIIPGSIIRNGDAYYNQVDLDIYFNVKRKHINQWLKRSVIKGRVVRGDGGKGNHLQLFLLKDNRGFFPPKKLLRIGFPVLEKGGNGREWYSFYPWYHYVDPLQYLKKYGIVQYLAVSGTDNKEQ